MNSKRELRSKMSMARSDNVHELPPNLPSPQDDGACIHLPGKPLPPLALTSTAGARIELVRLPGTTVVYCYPGTGHPDVESPFGWNEIPGARGCTPQACALRDNWADLKEFGVRLFGLSTQTSAYQRDLPCSPMPIWPGPARSDCRPSRWRA